LWADGKNLNTIFSYINLKLEEKNLKNKLYAIFLMLLLCTSSIFHLGNFYAYASGGGSTLYVGGTGGGNYSKIQDAIDNASIGDTVLVYSDTYYENVIVDVSIDLIGEDKDNTIIDGGGNGITVSVTSDWVNISGFTVQNCGDSDFDAGVKIASNHTNISDNKITDCDVTGVFLDGASNNTIYNNEFSNITNISTVFLWNISSYNIISCNNFTFCGCAIAIANSSYNNVSTNNMVNSTEGVYLLYNTTSNNTIFDNNIINSTYDGILIEDSPNNYIFENCLDGNNVGVKIFGQNLSDKNVFYHNNFINNSMHIYDTCNQTWDNGYPSGGNYWDDYDYSDSYTGSSQNITGSDGIGDIPYNVTGNITLDNFPLTYPWGEYSPVAEYTYDIVNMTVFYNASLSYDCDGVIVSYEWDFGDSNNDSGMIVNHTYSQNDTYNVTLTVTNDKGINDSVTKIIFVGTDTTEPSIVNISSDKSVVGFGFNITINASFSENISGIKTAMVNITYPDNTFENLSMTKISEGNYFLEFSDTWLNGLYNYSVWMIDYANNTNCSDVYSFNVSGQLDLSIATLKNDYGDNETINITDPPGEKPPIGYELLDNDQVLHIWNNHNSYYFNTSSGIQLTNHKDEYWTHNVLMLGYYNNDNWNLIYRTDELSGFTKNVTSDNETFVNATLWKDLTYQGYDFRLAIRYYLGVNDVDLTIIPYIKNIDNEDIPYVLGFGWEIKDIRIADVEDDNYLRIFNGTGFEDILLTQTLNNTYTDLRNNTIIRLICKNPPAQHKSRDLYLKWDKDLTYKVTVKSRSGQYNSPVSLFIRIGTLSVGQDKSTEMQWLDSDDWLGVGSSELVYSCDGQAQDLKNALDGTGSWTCDTNHDHWFILDLGENYTIKKFRGRSMTAKDPTDVDIYISCDNSSWSSAVASDISTWQDTSSWQEVDSTDKNGRYIKVVIEVTEHPVDYIEWGSSFGPPYMTIFDVYGDIATNFSGYSQDGYIYATSSSYDTVFNASTGTVDSTGNINIGQKKTVGFPATFDIYRGFLFFNTSLINSSDTIDSCKLFFYLDNEYVTLRDMDIVLQCDEDLVYPSDPLADGDYDRDHYSGDGGSVNTGDIEARVWNNISFNSSGLGWINKGGMSKFCLRSGWDIVGDDPSSIGDEYVVIGGGDGSYSPYLDIDYHFTQSKIVNCGSYDISGYLLMQVHYYNSSLDRWIVDHTVIEENTSRRINSSDTLALDTLFNGLLNSWNLSYGSGLYRVYAALCDSDGYVLRCDDDSFVEASWEFDVSFDSDKDSDGLSDYEERTLFRSQPAQPDTDMDTQQDYCDIDPLTDLEVTLTIKRIYASQHTYTWREGEDWDHSNTNNTGGTGHGTEWIEVTTGAATTASNGKYTRQNDPKEGYDDNASWDFIVLKDGVYYFWIRCHRDISACSNVYLTWENSTGSHRIYDRRWDDGGLNYEVSWWTNTTSEWKWSWFGLLNLEEGDEGMLNITNIEENKYDYPETTRGDWEEFYIKVDNILITDDPYCFPNGTGVEGSTNHFIGSDDTSQWDTDGSGPDFYVQTIIAGETHTEEEPFRYDDYDLLKHELDPDNKIGYVHTVNVDDGVENVPITIKLWEEDGATDLLCDINGTGNKTMDRMCNITYNLKNGTWWGDDYLGDIDYIGRTSGETDGAFSSALDATVIFEVSQNDNDNDGITFWQERNIWKAGEPGSEPIGTTTTNDRYAVIVGGGASCKAIQIDEIGDPDTGRGTYLLYDKGSDWSNYDFEVDILSNDKVDWDNEEIGVIFLYQDNDNYYILRWRNHLLFDKIYLQKRVNGNLTTLASKRETLRSEEWNRIFISLDDTIYHNIQIYLNVDKDDPSATPIIKCNDTSFSNGSIGLFCLDNGQKDSTYKQGKGFDNNGAWFDDVFVVDNDGSWLLEDGFDHGRFFDWTVIDETDSLETSNWTSTKLQVDMEDFYNTPDYIYRLLNLVYHYPEDNIYYLSADRIRDANGDGINDVDSISMKCEIYDAINGWLDDNSHWNNINFVYIFDHGFKIPLQDKPVGQSYFVVDSNRDGDYNDFKYKDDYNLFDSVLGSEMKEWLPKYDLFDTGRLTFMIEACYIGTYIEKLSTAGEKRNILVSTDTPNAAPETGRDRPAFSYNLLKAMGNGDMNLADAFSIADAHVADTNYLSKWSKNGTGDMIPGQDAKLDDNGDNWGSDGDPPNVGGWYDVYQGPFRDNDWFFYGQWFGSVKFYVNKARVRFKVRNDFYPKLYEFKFIEDVPSYGVSPTGHNDPDSSWINEAYAYDGNEDTQSSCIYDSGPICCWTPYIELSLSDPYLCNKIGFIADFHGNCRKIDVDVYICDGYLAEKTGL
jgi:parallel beta-helix repeat protein